jgi:hypothetical protein
LNKQLLCPSAPASPKATLLGAIQTDGSVAFIKDKIVATPEFLSAAAKHGAPESRFRFSSRCLGSACRQWSNDKCSLPERLADLIDANDAPLPQCSIRPQCRWYDQLGTKACGACSVVITRGNSTKVRI